MANTPALPTPYVSNANADTVNAGVTEWDAATESQQDAALSYGRSFIDSRYTCETFDEDDAPAEIQMANALFAVEYLKGTLYAEPETNVVEQSVKAGEVETRKRFARSGGTSTIDPFPAITAILSGTCWLRSSSSAVVSLVRG